MKHAEQRRLYAEFGGALLILLLVGVFVCRTMIELAQDVARVEHTHRVLDRLEQIDALAIDGAAAGRGFIITGDPAYLRTRAAVQPAMRVQLQALDRLLQGDRAMAPWLDSLRQMVARVPAVSTPTSRTDASTILEDVRREHDATQRVRSIAGTMRALELGQLDVRWSREKTTAIRAVDFSILGFLLVLMIVWGAVRRMRQSMDERLKAESRAVDARVIAENASRAKSDFLARVSHELRTPLNSVIGFSNVLLRNRGGRIPEQELSYVERIRANGLHLLGLIDDLLDLSRIEAGKPRLSVSQVDLELLIRETVAQLEGRLLGKGVVIRLDLPSRMEPIETDRGKLKQVLINLLGNAIRWTEVGTITLRVQVDGSDMRPVRLDVADTGAGISEAKQQTLFVAFENGSEAGAGLGLPISKSLCELMGYELTVTSAVGSGSTFSISLARSATGELAAPARAGTVLHVA